MVFLKLVELLVFLFLTYLFVTQILFPFFKGTRLFPAFRSKRIKTMNELYATLDEAEAKVVEEVVEKFKEQLQEKQNVSNTGEQSDGNS